MNLFVTLGKALANRSHHVIFFGIPEIAEAVRASGLEYRHLEPENAPTGTLAAMIRKMADVQGLQ